MAYVSGLALAAVLLLANPDSSQVEADSAQPGHASDMEPQDRAGAIAVPNGASPVLDGTIADREWQEARREFFKDGSELLLVRHGVDLYLGIRARAGGMIGANVFIESSEGISIYHVSAALGTAVYVKDGEGWRLARNFAWRCRRTDDGQEATAERDAFFREEGWVGSNSRMGAPHELELRIRPKAASFRLAIHYLRASEPAVRIPWPASLDDDTVKPTPGGLLPAMRFSPGNWAVIGSFDPPSFPTCIQWDSQEAAAAILVNSIRRSGGLARGGSDEVSRPKTSRCHWDHASPGGRHPQLSARVCDRW